METISKKSMTKKKKSTNKKKSGPRLHQKRKKSKRSKSSTLLVNDSTAVEIGSSNLSHTTDMLSVYPASDTETTDESNTKLKPIVCESSLTGSAGAKKKSRKMHRSMPPRPSIVKNDLIKPVKTETKMSTERTENPSTFVFDVLTSRRILYFNVLANAGFFIGAMGFLVFSSYELKNRCPDFHGANETYLLGFVGVFFSGLVELYVDLRFSRGNVSFRRSRYSSKFWLNILISVLFTIGNTFDVAAFFIWHTDNFQLEHKLIFAAAYIWLVVGVIVLLTVVKTSSFAQSADLADRFDAYGNIVFFVGSLIDVLARHTTELVERQDEQTYRVELTASVSWLLNATFFLASDYVRISSLRPNDCYNSLCDEPEVDIENGRKRPT